MALGTELVMESSEDLCGSLGLIGSSRLLSTETLEPSSANLVCEVAALCGTSSSLFFFAREALNLSFFSSSFSTSSSCIPSLIWEYMKLEIE